MGIRNTIEISCDYSDCKGSKTGPTVVQWNKEEVESGRAQAPPEAQYFVFFNQSGVAKAFCCQLHAALYFLPPGCEITQKKVIPFPEKPGWREEDKAVEQPDGCPDNGQGA